MNEIFQQIVVYAREALRYRWQALAIAWLVAVGGWLFVGTMPNQYSAQAKVYIDTDSILKPLLQGISVDTEDAGDRLGAMTRILLSRPNLEAVAQKVGIVETAETPEEHERALIGLARSIEIEASNSADNPRAAPDIYTINSSHGDPETAKKIVLALLETFMAKTRQDSLHNSKVAEEFLTEQISAYEEKLLASEKRVEEFKEKYADVLPEQGGSYFQRLQQSRGALSEAELDLRQAKRRRDELHSQLEKAREMRVILGPDGQPVRSPLEERILTLESRLDELSLRYTEFHPDYRETKATLQDLRRQRATLGNEDTGANPLVQQLQLTLGETKADIASLQVKRDEYAERVETLRRQTKTLPQVEAKLQRLTRDYNVHKERYNSLLERMAAARISEDVDKAGEKVKFSIIDPPREPVFPAAPNRPILNSLVLMVSLGMGVGLAAVLSQVRPAVYTRSMLEEIGGMEVIGSVALISSPEHKKQQLRERWLIGLVVVALVLVFGGITVAQLGMIVPPASG
ncbi:XrtA system polysaccharide chain length determinant [Thiohalomonas denitrificans]|uniref:XrtA system polysaccharide chain length determinant n=1 Tax=Thiohalomonas denitrificans TaxID=415747 RepID=UPI0026F2C1DA|nr:XrtA system polysaccharide chain length determinant [Thiohalomonas denitrificans]